jgi:CSLREA domain-containing protein
MPTEDHNSSDRSSQGFPQGVLALARMQPLKILASVGAALLVWGLLFAYLSSPAWAETITVTTTTDEQTTNGTCSLREAIEAANTNTVVDACVAGSATENDVINFALPGTAPWTVNLTAELPPLASNIEIDGPGADQLTVRRADTAVDNFRIFTVSGDTTVVTISGMTISNGNAVGDPGVSDFGGGILNQDDGTLTVTDSTISDNTADGDGGGIDNDGEGNLTVTGSTISGNTAGRDGGGIQTDTTPGTVTVSDSTISGNTADGDGGGIANNDDGTLTITDSTISGNTAGSGSFGGEGGGIFSNHDSFLTVTGSTISGNTASSSPFGGGAGGGIYYTASGDVSLTVTDSTISGNTAEASSAAGASGGEGGGIFSDTDLDTTTTIRNSTISGNTADGDGAIGGGVSNSFGLTVIEFSTITNNTASDGGGSGVASFGDDRTSTEVLSSIISANQGTDVDFVEGTTNSFVSRGYNLIGDGNATGAFNQTGDQTGVSDPKLGELADNGGSTMTHALLSGSPAINAIPQGTNGCGTTFTEDQRGVSRPQGSACDIGSFELEEVAENQAPTVAVAPGGSCGAASDMRGTINLTLADPDDPPESLTLTATSSNRSVLPNRNITFGGGTDASRTMTVSSLTGSGTSTVTVTVSDEGDLTGTVVVRVIAGTAANNTLTGSANADMIFARKGRDTASAQGANDLLCGGNGNDRLTGGPGADHFGGGSGTDTATDFNAGEGDTMAGIP